MFGNVRVMGTGGGSDYFAVEEESEEVAIEAKTARNTLLISTFNKMILLWRSQKIMYQRIQKPPGLLYS